MITLRDYQENISDKAAEKLHNNGLAYLSMEVRTGKTLTALATAAKYGAKSVLFITKIKAIPSIRADYDLLSPEYKLEIINYESVHKCTGEYDLIVCDESHSLGAYPKPSQRTKAVKTAANGKPVLYLSGTPTPESYSQLYHQLWVCSFSPFAKWKNFYSWAKSFVFKQTKFVNGYTIVDYSRANKHLIDEYTKQLFISYSQEQAGFSSNIVEHNIVVPMKESTSEYFKQLSKDKIITIDGKEILGDTPAKMLGKLHQLSSGTLIAEDGTHLQLDASKAEYVNAHFRGQKIAIFYTYQTEFEMLKSYFPNYTETPEEFQSSSDKVFISQVRKAREGVRLDSADSLIFFSFEYSYLSYEQGRNRLISKERKTPADVYFLCSDFGIDRDILDAVHGKQDFTLSYYGKCVSHRNTK